MLNKFDATVKELFIICDECGKPWPAHTPLLHRTITGSSSFGLTLRWHFPFSGSPKHALFLIVFVHWQTHGTDLNCWPPTHRSQTHCVGSYQVATWHDTGWHRWRVYRGAGWRTVTSYAPSPEGGCEIDNQNLVCFQLRGSGWVGELEIRKTIHHLLISYCFRSLNVYETDTCEAE